MAITIIICKFHKDNKSQSSLNFFLIEVEVIKSARKYLSKSKLVNR